MNFPNKLTTFRMLIIPVMVVIFFLHNRFPLIVLFSKTYSLGLLTYLLLFIVASVTDFIDGSYARKHNLITTYGKFMDPIADKLLVNITFFLLAYVHLIHPVVFIIMLFRDIVVDGLRMLASSKGVVIAAAKLGKLKTVLQMFSIIAILLQLGVMADILVYLATAVSVLSGLQYLYNGRNLILESI